jgi:hypothetical protein
VIRRSFYDKISYQRLLNFEDNKMLTDTIQISGLPETTLQGISDRAKSIGTTAEQYVRYLIDEDLSSSALNMRVLFAPVREQIKESGVSDDELTALLEEARNEVFQKNLGKK